MIEQQQINKKTLLLASQNTLLKKTTREPEYIIICDKSLMAHIYIKLIEFCLLCFMVWKCAQMAALKVTLFASLLFCIM